MMATIRDVCTYLETIAPLSRQEAYDNSGLLVGRYEDEVKGVLVSLDCTEEILDEAIQKGCNLVVSHHPVIFSGLKQLIGQDITQRIVMQALKAGINLYAIHTNLDNTLSSGVNERIAKQLGLKNISVLRPLESDKNLGAGGLGFLETPLEELDFLNFVQQQMKARMIRHTAFTGNKIEKVAICGGSGSFLLFDALKSGAQAFITSDFKYHQFFDADNRILIADIGHFEGEQFTIPLLQELISQKFPNFAAHCTEITTNPVQYHF